MNKFRWLPLLAILFAVLISCDDNGTISDELGIDLTAVGTAIGDNAPNFVLSDTEGNYIDLKDYKGKYVFIHFWASWCGTCTGIMDEVKSVNDAHKGDDYVQIGISVDYTEEAWRNYISNGYMDWLQVYDPSGIAATKYKVSGIPKGFLLDKEGIIIENDIFKILNNHENLLAEE